jgi:predicted transcriptional regulator of viral defense system
MPTFPRIWICGTIAGARLGNSSFFWGLHLATTRLFMKRLVSIVEKRAVVRARELYPFGVHPNDLSKAASQGLVVKISRGLYTRKDFPSNFLHQVALACLRIPHGIVCLQSALAWHGILPSDSGHIWMAIDRKAKKPVVDGLRLRFVAAFRENMQGLRTRPSRIFLGVEISAHEFSKKSQILSMRNAQRSLLRS